jgi:hypothetical protein
VADEVLVGVASNLRAGTRLHEAARDATPISLRGLCACAWVCLWVGERERVRGFEKNSFQRDTQNNWGAETVPFGPGLWQARHPKPRRTPRRLETPATERTLQGSYSGRACWGFVCLRASGCARLGRVLAGVRGQPWYYFKRASCTCRGLEIEKKMKEMVTPCRAPEGREGSDDAPPVSMAQLHRRRRWGGGGRGSVSA